MAACASFTHDSRSRPRRLTSTRTMRTRSSRRICAGPSDSVIVASSDSRTCCPESVSTTRSPSASGTAARGGTSSRASKRRCPSYTCPTVMPTRAASIASSASFMCTPCRARRARSGLTVSSGMPSTRSTRTSPVPSMPRTVAPIASLSRLSSSRSVPVIMICTSAREPLIISLVRSSIGCEIEKKVAGTSRSSVVLITSLSAVEVGAGGPGRLRRQVDQDVRVVLADRVDRHLGAAGLRQRRHHLGEPADHPLRQQVELGFASRG
jgi:hypothetical protein